MRELKNLRILLKINFPVNGLDIENTKNIKNPSNFIVSENSKDIEKNLVSDGNLVKNTDVAKIVTENLNQIKSDFDVFSNNKSKIVSGDLVILGELLKYLRESKNFSTLMVCRKIKSISVADGIAEIDFGTESDSDEYLSNEKYGEILREFFKSNGLGMKVKQFIKQESEADKLNLLLGGKLVIINRK